MAWTSHPNATIYATGGVLSTVAATRSSISADASIISSASVDQAMDVALYAGNLYVAQYKNSSPWFAVLSASDLSSIDNSGPPLRAGLP